MIIETPRLILRSLSEYDGPEIALATDETWDDLQAWMRWATCRQEYTDIANCSAYALKTNILFKQGKDLTFGGFSKDNGEFILLSRIAPHVSESNVQEFCGYWCRKKYQNNGYMTEAIQAITDFAFQTPSTQALQIKHATGNIQTRSVMNKIGFTEIAILKNAHELPNGSLVDEHILTLHR